MFVSIDCRYKVFVVSLFYIKHIIAGTQFNNFHCTDIFHKDNCNSAPNASILTILSALQTIERDLSFEIIH